MLHLLKTSFYGEKLTLSQVYTIKRNERSNDNRVWLRLNGNDGNWDTLRAGDTLKVTEKIRLLSDGGEVDEEQPPPPTLAELDVILTKEAGL